MSAADLPQVRVLLPDGQEVRARLHARQEFPVGGWMYWVGIALWADVPESESVEPREYRVWLTADQAQPVPGVSYDLVPTRALRPQAPTAQASDRRAWKLQHQAAAGGRPASVVVHVWDCPEAPAAGEELDVFAALDELRRPGAQACSECGADVALGPLA
ncbi:DUF6233 domain-containing protein [Streptomyces sp. NPDC057280]|uniref:DUF6233 domain-containing protein n=1 Tax=Streptomyces sp. NPDC057280 TaxID=3346081 RepID=UPI0036410D67